MSKYNGQNRPDAWDKLCFRLRDMARKITKPTDRKADNYAVLCVRVVVDENGMVKGWFKPSGDLLEPGGGWVLNTPLYAPLDEQP